MVAFSRGRPDGNCGRLVGSQTDRADERHMARRDRARPARTKWRLLSNRDQAVALVLACASPVVAGFDFSFGFPAWFAREHRCTTIADVWALDERDGEEWLASPPTPPFWRDRCEIPVERRFRRCEEPLRSAKSIFQLVGNGQIGAGSVRGMPHLARLREAGFAIWPFDHPSDRTVMEIYPSRLRKLAPHHDAGPFTNEHERDAVVSARVSGSSRNFVAPERRDRSDDPHRGRRLGT